MSKASLVRELVRNGDEILRIPRPPVRQKHWRQWRDQVKNVMEDIPALKNLGLRLTFAYLAPDIGILSRYANLMLSKPKLAEDIGSGKETVKGDKSETKNSDRASVSGGDGKLKIFISHKHEDERTARGVKCAIERYGAGRVEIFLSENIPIGTNWFKWIRRRLSESQMLILIFTDATITWDWPLYEAGLFTKLDDIENQSLICLHSDNLKPPRPLRHLQAVPAQVPKVTQFLKELFTDTKYKGLSIPLNPAMAEQPEELNRASNEIVDLISRRKLNTDFFTNFLFLNIGNLNNGQIPDHSTVISNASTLKLFGLKKAIGYGGIS